MKTGPRIYNLFPRLLGPIDKWEIDLRNIKEMEFNWVYVNPLNFTGFSGSLYSIKDFYKFNPIFAPLNSENPESWEDLKDFINKCHDNNLLFMIDLVINHVAIDSELLSLYPEWFIKKWALVNKMEDKVIKFFEDENKPLDVEYDQENYILEKRILNSFAIDPADSNNITIWGDLAEINLVNNPDLEGYLNYFKEYISFCLDLGVDGFRCDAAYKIPQNIWNELITYTKENNKNITFLAETLGCTIKECESVSMAGFDYIHSSSKYWDFTAPWCVVQYNTFRQYVPSISFPESHDTPRLAKETNGKMNLQIFRYFFSAFFSAGTMMPIGYEYGFKKDLNVVSTEPKDWEPIYFNISKEIMLINKFKQQYYCLNEDGEIKHFEYGDSNILVIRKTSLDKMQYVLLVYNKDWNESHRAYLEDIHYFLDFNTDIYQIYLDKKPEIILEKKYDKNLIPNEFFLLFQEKQ